MADETRNAGMIAELKAAAPEHLHPFIDRLLVSGYCDAEELADEEIRGDVLDLAERDYQEDLEEQERLQRDEAEHAAWKAVERAIEAIVARIEQLVEGRDGWSVEETYTSASSQSRYVTLVYDAGDYGPDCLTVRISEHAAPPYGGYDERTGDRHGEADVNIIIDAEAEPDLASIHEAISNHEREKDHD